jgi:hypothetical protein
MHPFKIERLVVRIFELEPSFRDFNLTINKPVSHEECQMSIILLFTISKTLYCYDKFVARILFAWKACIEIKAPEYSLG